MLSLVIRFGASLIYCWEVSLYNCRLRLFSNTDTGTGTGTDPDTDPQA